QVSWKAPALDTVLLRYSREEVTFILTYGRLFSPMPAWGIEGGGPMNEQQIQSVIDYLETLQITPAQAQAAAEGELREQLGLDEDDRIDYTDPEVGEALFNLGLTNGFAGGAYSCGRCHTQGWSYASSVDDLENPAGGALGPPLRGESELLQFPPDPTLVSERATVDDAEEACVEGERFEPPAPEGGEAAEGEGATTTTTVAVAELSTCQDHIDFVTEGSETGVVYGEHGQGSGRMPGFGMRPPEPALFWINKNVEREFTPTDVDGDGEDDIESEEAPDTTGMLTAEMIEAIVIYERTLEP
ncbi:MAG: c-type cytochrome, partial [Acidimicrobiales bacterium]